ncbi:mitochondrial import inner membrane translocase subunit Tim54 [Absidia repens]|uniref:Mitochondrial import inner membrane translocase subunit TIM54 n=1 Tax=Absidia repens TaxID=90262 RepID=A0A1X2IT25_9FUNG|nr:mitochondrial import inner membrane translocase subunit Tim54 [Absidia repens]
MPLPFGIKAPSRGTVIFTSIVGTIGGSYFGSKYYAQQSRQALCDKVSWLADRPCGVHERPRKVQVFLTAPPGDGLEKSRNWFSDYVKPVLVAAAIDYEVKEARQVGQIEKVVRDQVIERRKNEQQQPQQPFTTSDIAETTSRPNPFAPAMQDVLQQNAAAVDDFDGVIAIGRNAWREVVSGLDQGCTVSLRQVALEEAEAERQKTLDEEKQQQQKEQESSGNEATIDPSSLDEPAPVSEQVLVDISIVDNQQEQQQQQLQQEEQKQSDETTVDSPIYADDKDGFGVPAKLSPIMYVPHENIIGWTNIPYRIYMWLVDYQRIDRFGEYVVAVALNKVRPLAVEDLDVGHQEKKYWIGDDEAKTAKDQDQPIKMDDRVRVELKTYTN